MIIPERFNLYGLEITIEPSDTIMLTKQAIGYCEPQLSRIVLQQHTMDYPILRQNLEHTYLHELVHMILIELGEKELGDNEKFVDSFAGLLHQVHTTSVGELKIDAI
jgi:hypothetical protein